MSKPRDPVLAVLKYFETAELPLARQALALAQNVVKQRQPPRPPVKTPPKGKAKGNSAVEQTVS